MGTLIIFTLVLLASAMGLRNAIILMKRPERKRELRHHIDMILDLHGCEHATEHFRACQHIIEHYEIPLADVGYPGSLVDLWGEVGSSLCRANQRSAAAQIMAIPTVFEQNDLSRK